MRLHMNSNEMLTEENKQAPQIINNNNNEVLFKKIYGHCEKQLTHLEETIDLNQRTTFRKTVSNSREISVTLPTTLD